MNATVAVLRDVRRVEPSTHSRDTLGNGFIPRTSRTRETEGHGCARRFPHGDGRSPCSHGQSPTPPAQYGRPNTALQAGGRRFDPGTLHKLPANRVFSVVFLGETAIRRAQQLRLKPLNHARSRALPEAALPADSSRSSLRPRTSPWPFAGISPRRRNGSFGSSRAYPAPPSSEGSAHRWDRVLCERGTSGRALVRAVATGPALEWPRRTEVRRPSRGHGGAPRAATAD